MSERQFCNQPDRDVPGLKCGYPLPCPYHTATIDLTKEPAEVSMPVTAKAAITDADRLASIAKALSQGNIRNTKENEMEEQATRNLDPGNDENMKCEVALSDKEKLVNLFGSFGLDMAAGDGFLNVSTQVTTTSIEDAYLRFEFDDTGKLAICSAEKAKISSADYRNQDEEIPAAEPPITTKLYMPPLSVKIDGDTGCACVMDGDDIALDAGDIPVRVLERMVECTNVLESLDSPKKTLEELADKVHGAAVGEGIKGSLVHCLEHTVTSFVSACQLEVDIRFHDEENASRVQDGIRLYFNRFTGSIMHVSVPSPDSKPQRWTSMDMTLAHKQAKCEAPETRVAPDVELPKVGD